MNDQGFVWISSNTMRPGGTGFEPVDIDAECGKFNDAGWEVKQVVADSRATVGFLLERPRSQRV